MKGHGSNSRYRLKTKTIHGVRTGHHDNPHVMKAAARAGGGSCDGESKMGHLGKMGRMRKREDGGLVGLGGQFMGASTTRCGGRTRCVTPNPMRPGGPTVAGPPAPSPDMISQHERDAAHEQVMKRVMNDENFTVPIRRKDGGVVGRKDGGPLNAKERNALPSKAFALKGRRYPINDKSHARNALARVSQHGTPAEKAEVKREVKAKFPGIGQKKADGGEVSDAKVGDKELKQHALEHKALAEKKD